MDEQLESIAREISDAVIVSTDIFAGFATEVPLIDLALVVSVAAIQLNEMDIVRAKALLAGAVEAESARQLHVQTREAFDRLNKIVQGGIQEAITDPEVASKLYTMGPQLNALRVEFMESTVGERVRSLQAASAAGRRLVDAIESGAVSREKAQEMAEAFEQEAQTKTMHKKPYKKARGW